MRCLVLLLALAMALAQEVEYVKVSDNHEDNSPTPGYEAASMAPVAEEKDVVETKYYSSDNRQAAVAEAEAEAEIATLLEMGEQVKSPRQYIHLKSEISTGVPLRDYKNTSPRKCLKLCSAYPQRRCVGFVVSRRTGACTLFSDWGGTVFDTYSDAYKAMDYSAAPVFVGNAPVESTITLKSQQQVLILADVTRIRAPRNDLTIELELTVDDNHEFAAITNINNHYGEIESFRNPSFHSLSLPASAGNHQVALTYKQGHTNGPVIQSSPQNRASAAARLTIIPFPLQPAQSKVPYDAVGQVWNRAKTAYGSDRNWSPIPGGMKIKFAAVEGQQVLILADISRVQHSLPNVNAAFRLVLDGKEVAFTNTGASYAWDFKQLALRTVVPSSLTAGEHTIQVEYKTPEGSVVFLNDGNGSEQLRLTAVLVPPKRAWKTTVGVDNDRYAPLVKNTKEWQSSFSGNRANPLKLTLTPDVNGLLLVFVSLSRVQTYGAENLEFMLAVVENGQPKPIAKHNTGIVQGWRFRDLSFHATLRVMEKKPVTLQVFYRSRTGGPIGHFDDGNGHQQRSINAVLIEDLPGTNTIVTAKFGDQ